MEKFHTFIKSIKKEQLILCFLFGILLLVVVMPTGATKDTVTKEVVSQNASLLESKLQEALMQMEGIGQVEVTIALEPLVDNSSNPQITGVLVVSTSGDNPVAVQKIQETVMTLFQLEAHKIIVMKMK